MLSLHLREFDRLIWKHVGPQLQNHMSCMLLIIVTVILSNPSVECIRSRLGITESRAAMWQCRTEMLRWYDLAVEGCYKANAKANSYTEKSTFTAGTQCHGCSPEQMQRENP